MALEELLMSQPLIPIVLVVALGSHAYPTAQHATAPTSAHESHIAQSSHDKALEKRGREAMGFDQDRTTHHFVLRPDGGVISVEVKAPGDEKNRDAIRTHLRRIASEFAAGRFDAPVATHAEEPSGTAVMRALAASIRYSVEDTAGGGVVRIASSNRKAVAAVHDFLRYQIREHRTGDAMH
jgi:hypothetical protein